MKAAINSGVYLMTCKVNGAKYVGQARNFAERWKSHRNLLAKGTHQNSRMQWYANTYGVDVFEFSILQGCEVSKLDLCEAVHICRLRPGLNVMPPKPKVLKMAEAIADAWYAPAVQEWVDRPFKACENCGDPVRDPTYRHCTVCKRSELRKMRNAGYLQRQYGGIRKDSGHLRSMGGGSWDNVVRAMEGD